MFKYHMRGDLFAIKTDWLKDFSKIICWKDD